LVAELQNELASTSLDDIERRAELNKQITDFINSEKVEDIKNNSISKDEAKNKVNQFFL